MSWCLWSTLELVDSAPVFSLLLKSQHYLEVLLISSSQVLLGENNTISLTEFPFSSASFPSVLYCIHMSLKEIKTIINTTH